MVFQRTFGTGGADKVGGIGFAARSLCNEHACQADYTTVSRHNSADQQVSKASVPMGELRFLMTTRAAIANLRWRDFNEVAQWLETKTIRRIGFRFNQRASASSKAWELRPSQFGVRPPNRACFIPNTRTTSRHVGWSFDGPINGNADGSVFAKRVL